EMAARQVPGEGGAIVKDLSLSSIEPLCDDFATGEAAANARRIDDGLRARKNGSPAVTPLSRLELRDGLEGAADVGRAQEASVYRRHDDVPIVSPTGADRTARTANVNRGAAFDSDLLHLAGRKKADPMAVGREKGSERALGPFKERRIRLIQTSGEKTASAVLAKGDEHDTGSVRRDHHVRPVSRARTDHHLHQHHIPPEILGEAQQGFLRRFCGPPRQGATRDGGDA